MKEDENTLKAKIVGNRALATLALVGALACMHYSYAASLFWQQIAWGIAVSFLCGTTIKRTVKASVYASALVVAGVIDHARKEGILR